MHASIIGNNIFKWFYGDWQMIFRLESRMCWNCHPKSYLKHSTDHITNTTFTGPISQAFQIKLVLLNSSNSNHWAPLFAGNFLLANLVYLHVPVTTKKGQKSQYTFLFFHSFFWTASILPEAQGAGTFIPSNCPPASGWPGCLPANWFGLAGTLPDACAIETMRERDGDVVTEDLNTISWELGGWVSVQLPLPTPLQQLPQIQMSNKDT